MHAGDLALDKFIDKKTLNNAAALQRPTGDINTVLMTGANGFLGRFLCLEWLERLARTGGTLICIARGGDADAARHRIEAAFDTGDAELARHFHDLAEAHLQVLAGDISESNLGLDQPIWSELANTVDLIVHPAALVNHVLPYSELFRPNVVGTTELIRLAITTRLKAVHYVSTIAVAMLDDGGFVNEQADIRDASPTRVVGKGYASGYAISKWAAEVVLREAHDLCGLPVTVFRCNMILAHNRFAGQLNMTDMFTRLIFSVVATGIAPRSFYTADVGEGRPRAHYDGLPVDFTAEAIVGLGAVNDGFQAFNVLNPHDDGISIDNFVDWLIDAGHPIQRIDSYSDWLTRFEAAMRLLPDKQRQQSVLALLDAFRLPPHPAPAPDGVADEFRAGVQAGAIGHHHGIPHLSAPLIHKYISDLRALGLL